ncbi:MAG: hypothetical protein AAF961_19050 [Planctomycetota bacterium]
MEFNRNQYFFLGVLLILLGMQFRWVKTFVLTDEATQFLAERVSSASDSAAYGFSSDLGAAPKKVIEPPPWLGWILISVGAVLFLHSLAMKKPGG